jgi:Tfp pilus assembly protein PilF
MSLRLLLLLGSLLTAAALPLAAQAPDARYRDADPAAQFVEALDTRDRRRLNDLENVLRRDPNNVPGRVQMGRLWLDRGQSGRAAADFQRAITAAGESGEVLSRFARWNYGWALFETADPAGALEQWRLAAEGHGGRPYWVPLVEAIERWMQGDRDGAVAWFAAAVRSEPARWETPEALAAQLGDWPVNARFTLESVQQAWSQQR